MGKWGGAAIMSMIILLLSLMFDSDHHSEVPIQPKKRSPAVNSSAVASVTEVVSEQDKIENLQQVASEQLDEVVREQDYVVPCRFSAFKQPDKTQTASLINYVDSLHDSAIEQERLVAIFFGKYSDRRQQFDALLAFQQDFPGNELVLLELVGQCSYRPKMPECNSSLFNSAVKFHGGNGYMWYLLVNYHIAVNDERSAIEAIEEMTKAPYYDEYFHKGLALFHDIAKGAQVNDFNTRYIVGTGIQAAKPMYGANATEFCIQKENVREQVSNACLTMGKTLQKRSKVELNTHIGYGYQKLAYEAMGDFEAAKIIEQNKQAYSSSEGPAFRAALLASFDEGLYLSWLNNVNEYGEKEANRLNLEEAIHLSKNEDYDPCLLHAKLPATEMDKRLGLD